MIIRFRLFLNAFAKMQYRSIFVLFLCLSPVCLIAQTLPPQIRCISVESNGNVTLTWIASSDTGTAFGGYHIFSASSASGPFVPADSIFSYSTLTTTLTNVNANNTILYFYLRTREGCCSVYSVPGDTVRTIRMIVTPLSNETVKLNWNRIHTPPLPSTLSSFVLSKELTTGVYTNFRSLPDTTTTDTNYYCNKFINYKVTQGDLSGCLSGSSVDGELFRDTKGPAKPLLDTVSIDMTTGEVDITWFPDSSADTQGYVIYQFNGLSYDSIGAVNGINSLLFTTTGSSSSGQVETYTVAAFDSCKNLGALAANHVTMLLQKSFVKCTATITLDWTPYQNMNDGLSRYEIWYSENGGPWQLDGFVPGNILNYEKILTVQGATYEFLIRAVGGEGQTASSNIISQVADIYQMPSYLYIRALNVLGEGVRVKCLVDPAGATVSYRLYRGQTSAGPFTFAGEKPYSGNPNLTFFDADANAGNGQVFYKITSTDSCGLEQIASNVAGTVFLTAEGGNDFISQLLWVDYLGWQGVTGHFNIYMATNGVLSASPLATVSGDTLFYTDDISDFPVQDGNICYAVQAVEDSINSFGFIDSSISNIACAPQSPAAYIPNAFTPKGKNPVFRPFLLFGNPDTYSFRVFNRWGQTVFNSTVAEAGWNGTMENGDAAPAGIYAYLLVFKGYNKKEVRRSGTVMLLR